MKIQLPNNVPDPNQPKPKAELDDGADIKAFDGKKTIEELLVFATEHKCSDLYIKVDDPPYLARFGKKYRVPCRSIDKQLWKEFYDNYISNELKQIYVSERLLDTSVAIRVPETSPNFETMVHYRYRVSFGFSQSKNWAVFRMIKPEKPTFDTINYNPKCIEALRYAYSQPSGICYETGPTGSGKSTTMAATINSFSTPGGILDNKVIITLEDPIENEFDSTESVRVVQKELGKDFRTFALGIKASLREHPNMIIVGECRDKEVICAAIEAARTGHITSTTFHAADVAGTVNRLLYHLDNDKNLSLDLIMQLNIILSQKMLKQEGKYLVDTQYLLFTPQVREMLSNTLKAGGDLSEQINKMIADPQYQAVGWVKDWDYKHLHGEGG